MLFYSFFFGFFFIFKINFYAIFIESLREISFSTENYDKKYMLMQENKSLADS